jgi:hypothetical protein
VRLASSGCKVRIVDVVTEQETREILFREVMRQARENIARPFRKTEEDAIPDAAE